MCKIKIFSLFYLSLILLSGCKKGQGTIHLGENTSSGVAITDTMRVISSTVMLDSLPTSGTGVILLGKLTDGELGVIHSSSFFQIGIPENYSRIVKEAIFDSIVVKLRYNKYYYGDTSLYNSLEVHQLAKKIELIDNDKYNDLNEKSVLTRSSALYNNSSIPYNSLVLGTARFKPKPISGDSISIKLNSDMGIDLLKLLKDNDSKITDQKKFTDYFKGLALVNKGDEGNSIVAFKANSAAIQLYYSENTPAGVLKAKSLKLKLADSTLQFNKISSDRSNTVLKKVSYANSELGSSETLENCFVQSGIGLVTKIKFPGITELLNDKTFIINKAQLIIEVSNSNLYKLPQKMILFRADKKNKPQSVIQGFQAKADQLADLIEESAVTGGKRYIFNITDYLSALKKVPNNQEYSLLFSTPLDKLCSSIESVITGTPDNPKLKIKLNILYTKYNKDDFN